jgi:hypothetical protein
VFLRVDSTFLRDFVHSLLKLINLFIVLSLNHVDLLFSLFHSILLCGYLIMIRFLESVKERFKPSILVLKKLVLMLELCYCVFLLDLTVLEMSLDFI